MRPPPATVLAVLLLPVPARLQGPATLVLDIQPQPVTNWLATGDPNWYGFPSVGQLGNLALFSGRMPYGGRELFVSDGSPFGARLLKDIDPGPDHSHPHGFTELPSGIGCSSPPSGLRARHDSGAPTARRLEPSRSVRVPRPPT